MGALTSEGSQQDLLVKRHGALVGAAQHVPHCLIDGEPREGVRHLMGGGGERKNQGGGGWLLQQTSVPEPKINTTQLALNCFAECCVLASPPHCRHCILFTCAQLAGCYFQACYFQP